MALRKLNLLTPDDSNGEAYNVHAPNVPLWNKSLRATYNARKTAEQVPVGTHAQASTTFTAKKQNVTATCDHICPSSSYRHVSTSNFKKEAHARS